MLHVDRLCSTGRTLVKLRDDIGQNELLAEGSRMKSLGVVGDLMNTDDDDEQNAYIVHLRSQNYEIKYCSLSG